jgi:hypothetical protein
MSGSDRPSPPWVCSKVGPPRPELPAAAKRAIRSSLRTSRTPASTPHISSSAVTHLLTPTFLSLRRACGSIWDGKSHEMRGIHSSTGMQMLCPKDMSSSQTSPLTLPACAAAQVNVDFLDGEEWARSTSYSREYFRIFDILFGMVDVSNLLARCAARARLPSLSVPSPCCCSLLPCSSSLCFPTLN